VSGCYKIPYSSRSEATQVFLRNGWAKLPLYRCPTCRKLHATSHPRKGKW
jgi:hypothetical protein